MEKILEDKVEATKQTKQKDRPQVLKKKKKVSGSKLAGKKKGKDERSVCLCYLSLFV